jgi:hypothetical protein
MSFISSELHESRLFRSDAALKTRTAEDIKNIVFLYFVTLSIMKEEFLTAPWAQDYLTNTFKYGKEFKTVRRSDNDLYWGIYVINNKLVDKLSPKYVSQNEVQMERLNLPMNIIIPWVKNSIRGMSTSRETFRVLKTLEQSLQITESDYRTLLAAATHWHKINDAQRSIVCTRLLQALRKYARMSEIYPEFEQFAKKKLYIIQDAVDIEQPVHKTSAVKTILGRALIGAGVGYALGKMLTRSSDQYRTRIKEEFETIVETTSAAIATTVLPLGEIKRRQYAKSGSRTVKYFP